MKADDSQLTRQILDRYRKEPQARIVENNTLVTQAVSDSFDKLPEFKTVEQVAAVLQLSHNTVRSLLHQHIIPGKKLSHKWVIPREALFKALVEG